jgi:hypothetical protein
MNFLSIVLLPAEKKHKIVNGNHLNVTRSEVQPFTTLIHTDIKMTRLDETHRILIARNFGVDKIAAVPPKKPTQNTLNVTQSSAERERKLLIKT